MRSHARLSPAPTALGKLAGSAGPSLAAWATLSTVAALVLTIPRLAVVAVDLAQGLPRMEMRASSMLAAQLSLVVVLVETVVRLPAALGLPGLLLVAAVALVTVAAVREPTVRPGR